MNVREVEICTKQPEKHGKAYVYNLSYIWPENEKQFVLIHLAKWSYSAFLFLQIREEIFFTKYQEYFWYIQKKSLVVRLIFLHCKTTTIYVSEKIFSSNPDYVLHIVFFLHFSVFTILDYIHSFMDYLMFFYQTKE